MSHQFQKHYTRDEARELLPSIRVWLASIRSLRVELAKYDERIEAEAAPGRDLGGPLINNWVRKLTELHSALSEFYSREIQIKDLDRGLIDFPAIMQEREVFLCWEEGEEDIEFWHELDAGYAGRERLD